MSDPRSVSVRPAEDDDAVEIAGLVAMLAAELGDPTAVTPAYVADYLHRPGCHALLVVRPPEVLGLLSYSSRPSLYHAADSCLLDELIVQPAERNCGVGTLLLNEVNRLAREQGCAALLPAAWLRGSGVAPRAAPPYCLEMNHTGGGARWHPPV